MSDHPIIFSPSMVQALIAGRKTQTRRLLYTKRKAKDGVLPASAAIMTYTDMVQGRPVQRAYQPTDSVLDFNPDEYYALSGWQRRKKGDRLWVRENVKAVELEDNGLDCVRYEADGAIIPIQSTEKASNQWVDLHHYRKKRGAPVPSIHMPRWASRLTLSLTATKIERVQAITVPDAMAEGIRLGKFGWTFFETDHPNNAWDTPKGAFEMLWKYVNGYESWEWNPWVVALTFTVAEQNIDRLEKEQAA